MTAVNVPWCLGRQYDQLPPALAMKVLLQFDKAISAALANRVKSRLSFKVRLTGAFPWDVVSDAGL